MAEIDIRRVTGRLIGENTYVVSAQGAEDCVLIDPGAEEDRIREAIGGRRVAAVLLTHGHFDHMLSAAAFLVPGVRLYAHRDDVPLLLDARLNQSEEFIGEELTLPAPDVLLSEGDEVREAGLAFTVLHTPGHTKGSVCYLCGDVLFSGDTLFAGDCGRTDMYGGNEADMQRSLRRLRKLDGETRVLPGHGPQTRIGWEK